jgi:membrane protein DedA with SNARE-associated domain
MRRRWFLLTTVLALPSYTGITALVGSRFGHYVPWINWISIAILVLLLGYLLFFVLPGLVRRRRRGRGSASTPP